MLVEFFCACEADLLPLARHDMRQPPRAGDLVTVQRGLGSPRQFYRVLEVVWDLPALGTSAPGAESPDPNRPRVFLVPHPAGPEAAAAVSYRGMG